MKGWIITRRAADGTLRYDASWWIGSKKKSKTFDKKRAAERHLNGVVAKINAGTYVEVHPTLMGEVFDRWLEHSLDVRLAEGSLKPSAAKSYRSMVRTHLKPAFGAYRSDRFTLTVVEQWRAGIAKKIRAGTMAPKFYVNLKNLLNAIVGWARHPDRQYLAHDPIGPLPKIDLPKAKKRPHFEPPQVAVILKAAAATPPDDTIIRVAVYAGLRRGEIFGLRWPDLDAGNGQDGGRLHVRRSLYQGSITTPKTEDSDRVVDVPQRLLDDLEVYKLMSPLIGDGYVFRQPSGRPLDPDRWHRERLVPILKGVGLYQRGIGLHSIGRHTYVSLLIAQGEDVGYIADQVGHSTTRLTQDLYRHVFKAGRVEAMRRLNGAIPSGTHPAEPAEVPGTGRNSVEPEG
jgi:integrase